MSRGLAGVAAAIAEPVRARMLDALLAGGSLPAGELADRAHTSRSNASGHLAVLLQAGLVDVAATGRRRLYRLAGPDVARALESLALLAPPERTTSLRAANADEALRAARTCYDHLAGRLGVGVTDALVDAGAVAVVEDGFELADAAPLEALGVDLAWARAQRRVFARSCLDWSERRPHLAGALGASVLRRLVDAAWVERRPGGRSVRLTPAGRAAVAASLGVTID